MNTKLSLDQTEIAGHGTQRAGGAAAATKRGDCPNLRNSDALGTVILS